NHAHSTPPEAKAIEQMKLASGRKGSCAADGHVTRGLRGSLPVNCAIHAVPIPIPKTTGLLMNKPADATREHAVEIRFGQVGLLQVRLHTTDPGSILDELTGRTATAPHFFERTAVCLDLSTLAKPPRVDEIRA